MVTRLIPESVSWLIVKGRIQDAHNQLKFVAKVNNKTFQVREFYLDFINSTLIIILSLNKLKPF